MKTTYSFSAKNNISKLEAGIAQSVERAAREIAKAAEVYAASACPVDTGRLQGSITGKAKENRVEVRTNGVEYALYQEIGTRYIAPRHFIRYSLANHWGEYRQILETTMKEGE